MFVRMFAGTLVVAAGILGSVTQAQEKTAHVSTLEWPPYTSETLPLNGATTEVVRAAFAQADHQLDVAIRPWKRAIDVAAKGTDGVIAYFPGYHCRNRDGFIASDPIGNGPLGFAENGDAPIDWDRLEQLSAQKLRIGTVLGYANTDDFDQMAAEGRLNVLQANHDLTNLKMLSKKRIDAVVIDKLVLEYLKATDPALKDAGKSLIFDGRPLEDKTLYLCFRDDDAGRAAREVFNAGLAEINPDEIVKNYFSTAFSQ